MHIRFISLFDHIAKLTALFLLLVVGFSIIARIINDLSAGSINLMIPGAIELSKYALLVLVFYSLPRASSHKMIRVELLSNRLPQTARLALNTVWLLLMALFMAVIAFLFIKKSMLTFDRGDATQDLIMPLFYFYGLISLSCIASSAACISKIFNTNTLENTQ